MTGEEVFNLLNKMATRGDNPRRRERQLRRIAEKAGLSSDALRAKARRHARKLGRPYPLMRKPATGERESAQELRRSTRESWRQARIEMGRVARERGADWGEIAKIFEIKTPEGAAQWWKRNQPEATPRRAPGRKRKAG